MLNRTDIKAMTYTSTYSKGLDLYRGNKVLDMSIEGNDPEYITVQVQGSGRKLYEVEITYNTLLDDIEYAVCECPAYRSYDGLCKHCVAALLNYIDYKKLQQYRQDHAKKTEDSLKSLQGLKGMSGMQGSSQKPRPKLMTSPDMKQLLTKQQLKSTLPLLQEETYGKVHLEPCLTCTAESIQLEFKIGVSHMYVLKDVFSFVKALEDKETISYGRQLEFVHTIEMFDGYSRPIVKFIQNWTRENMIRFMQNMYYGYSGGYGSAPSKLRSMPLSTGDLEAFLEALGGSQFMADINNSGKEYWQETDAPLNRTLKITGQEEGISLTIGYLFGFQGNHSNIYFENGSVFKVSKEALEPINDFLSCMAKLPDRTVFIGKEDVPVFCRELLPVLEEHYKCTKHNFDERDYGALPVSFQFYLDAPGTDIITCRPVSVYGDQTYPVYDKDNGFEHRDMAKEIKIGKIVSSFCNAYDEMEYRMVIGNDEEKQYEFLVHGIPKLQQLGEVFISDALKKIHVASAPKVSVGVSLSGDLLELSLTAGDMPREQLIEILSRYNRKKKFYRLKNGDFVDMGDNIGALLELKQGLNLTNEQLKQEIIVMPRYRALYLDGELKEHKGLQAAKDKEFKALIRNMKTIEDNDFEIPAGLRDILREYQKQGFLWIKTLKTNGFGGILADDMGLGKTLQVIAFLESEYEEAKDKENHRCLIVSPASLVFNWSSELQKFAPDLPVRMVVGAAAERKAMILNSCHTDILLTSYDLLKRDISTYEQVSFHSQIIDEAQYIKNHNTQAAKAVKAVKAGFKLALTGTPVENRLSELWSIFDYLMPGFLFPYQRFREEFEQPIVQNGNEDAMKRLQKMITPFILRRLKTQVLSDLPDKLEKNVFARMEGEQQKLYDAHVKRIQMMLNKQSEEEFNSSKIQILSELTRLRQICCHPGLIFEGYEAESVKMDMCLDLIQNAVSCGHKILLFSQFTSMLSKLQERMRAENISYYTLTGAVSKEKRAGLVEQFNQDETSVFCISLKAGGTGLNLTSADIVIHYDPWWNLAVQNQATDRAHRIGQENVVTVYKLIVKGTIEENIMKLQERKRELADQILCGEGLSSGSFSRDELMELLKG